jgi:hypothetical protein
VCFEIKEEWTWNKTLCVSRKLYIILLWEYRENDRTQVTERREQGNRKFGEGKSVYGCKWRKLCHKTDLSKTWMIEGGSGDDGDDT